jgi:hypothetical protein
MEGELRDRRDRAEDQNKASKKKRPECEVPQSILTSQLIGRIIRPGNANKENSIDSTPKNQDGTYGDQRERPEFLHQCVFQNFRNPAETAGSDYQ